MGWALGYIEKLKAGETVQFRPRGHSMRGKVDSGDLVTVEPVDPATLVVGDIVLCKVRRARVFTFDKGNQRLPILDWQQSRIQ